MEKVASWPVSVPLISHYILNFLRNSAVRATQFRAIPKTHVPGDPSVLAIRSLSLLRKCWQTTNPRYWNTGRMNRYFEIARKCSNSCGRVFWGEIEISVTAL